jgi:hypothetical protein
MKKIFFVGLVFSALQFIFLFFLQKNELRKALIPFIGVCLVSMLLLPHPAPAAAVRVEILYMNHGPMQPTLRNLKELLAGFQDRVAVQWFDVDQAAGKAFMEEKKIRGHVPLLIFVNGEKQFTINGREVTFQGFPTGSGPFSSVEGNWTPGDLRTLLDGLAPVR